MCKFKEEISKILVLKQGRAVGFRARAWTAEINCICLAVTGGSESWGIDFAPARCSLMNGSSPGKTFEDYTRTENEKFGFASLKFRAILPTTRLIFALHFHLLLL